MCRIFGNLGATALTRAELRRMSNAQLAGGPDQQAFTFGPRWSLGANRLAIQGLDGGSQPYRHESGVTAVMNGEIYNHAQLRRVLRNAGHAFNDTCDGSLIPALYLEYGDAFVTLLDGMFAVAVLDPRIDGRPRLVLATDAAGTKSLYYWQTAGDLVFSSELPSLVRLPRVRTRVRPAAIDTYLSMLAVLGPDTAFEDVRQLPPSSTLVAQPGLDPAVSTYRSSLLGPEPDPDLENSGTQLRELLDGEVRQMLRADVPVTLITSGGLDSSLLTALAARHAPDLHTFNIAYRGEWPDDERHYAEKVARSCGVNYHQVEADPASFPDVLPDMVATLGQPNAAPHALSAYLLFRDIRQAGFKVTIAGEGSDELFGGHARFATAAQGGDGWAERYMDALAAVPHRLRTTLYTAEFRSALTHQHSPTAEIRRRMLGLGRRPTLADLLNFEHAERFPYYILRRTDHLSMAHSVEVRVPFCQPRVVDFARRLPDPLKLRDGQVKRVVYAAADRLVPDEVLQRRKQPFTLPIGAMMRPGHPLYAYTYQRLRETNVLADFIDPETMHLVVREQSQRPNPVAAKLLWALLILELWLDRHA